MSRRTAPTSLGDFLPVSALYNSKDMIIINKPPDVRMDGDEQEISIEKLLAKAFPDERFKWVHQLDYATSGVLAVAKHRDAAVIGTSAFGRRETYKEYLAVVLGHVHCSSTNVNIRQHAVINPLDVITSSLDSDYDLQSKVHSWFTTIPMETYDNRIINSVPSVNNHKLMKRARKQESKLSSNSIDANVVDMNGGNEVSTCALDSTWEWLQYVWNYQMNSAIYSDEPSIDNDKQCMMAELTQLHQHSKLEFSRNRKLRKQLSKFLRLQTLCTVPASINAGSIINNDSEGTGVVDVIRPILLDSVTSVNDNSPVDMSITTIANTATTTSISDCGTTEAVDQSTSMFIHNDAYPPRIYAIPILGKSSYDIMINIPIADAPASCSHSNNNNNRDQSQQQGSVSCLLNDESDGTADINNASNQMPSNLYSSNPFLMYPGRRFDEQKFGEDGQLLPLGREAETSLHVLEYGYYPYYYTPSVSVSDSHVIPEDLHGTCGQVDCISHSNRHTHILWKPVTKVKLIPITGRRHQLRIHCKAIGHPILGDVSYCQQYFLEQYFKRQLTQLEPTRPISLSTIQSHWVYNTERMMLHAAVLYLPVPDVCCQANQTIENTDTLFNNSSSINNGDDDKRCTADSRLDTANQCKQPSKKRFCGSITVHKPMVDNNSSNSNGSEISDVAAQGNHKLAMFHAANNQSDITNSTTAEYTTETVKITARKQKQLYADHMCKLIEPPVSVDTCGASNVTAHTLVKDLSTGTSTNITNSTVDHTSEMTDTIHHHALYYYYARAPDPFPFSHVTVSTNIIPSIAENGHMIGEHEQEHGNSIKVLNPIVK